jgi:hypothetical protein
MGLIDESIFHKKICVNEGKLIGITSCENSYIFSDTHHELDDYFDVDCFVSPWDKYAVG